AANANTATEIGKLDTRYQGYAATAKSEAVREANKYTDKAALQANKKELEKANTYTDDTAKKTLKTANEHTERRAVIAENNAVTRSNAYTDESSFRTLERANTYTNHRATQAENNAVARSNAYTNKRFGELKNQVDRNEKRANGGIAGAMAMTAIPSVPGHNFSFGMAASGYRDQGAIAAGVKANITQDTTVSLNTAWDSGNGVGVAAGFSVGW
ncbi:YadA-like family protein, partial [Salmonella enterica]|nr:YadA-like family protein [Salmonella enterica]